MKAEEFWDNIFSQGQQGDYSRVELPDFENPILNAALEHFGDVKNKTIIDLGCGRGATSLFFAKHGANVISTDLSEVAISNLSNYCREHEIDNITPRQLRAQEIGTLGKVDCVFGCMILHHIEPFSEFAACLAQVLPGHAKGFFCENSANSKMLIWFRENVVGKLWVPKHGDDEEFPLTPDEVDELKKHFQVHVEYPELVMFRLIAQYIFRGRFVPFFLWLDRAFYRVVPLRKYSYRQYLYLNRHA